MAPARRSSTEILRALHELAVVTTGHNNPAEVAKVAAQTATRLIGDAATLRWWSADANALVLLYDTGRDAATPIFPPAGGAASRAFASGEPVVVSDAIREGSAGLYPRSQARSVAAVPMVMGDRRLGTLAVRCDRPRVYGKRAVRLLQLIAAQSAPALVAAQDAADRERANRTLSFLHELAVHSGGILDPSQLADLAARRACELLEADGGALAMADTSGELFSSTDTDFGALPGQPGAGILWRAFDGQKPVQVEDYAGDVGAVTVPGLVIQSALAVPLVAGDRAIGALGVRSRSKRRFSPIDVRTLELLAAQVAPALEGARVHRELQRRTAAMIALDALASEVGKVLDEHRIVEMAVERVRQLLSVDVVTLNWFDASSQRLAAISGASGGPLVGEASIRAAFDTGRPVVIDSPNVEAGDGRPVAAVAVVPLRVGERVVGTLGAQAAPPRVFLEEDVQVLSLVAAQLAPAIEAARLHEDLERSRRELRAVLDHAGVLLFAVDREGRYRMVEGEKMLDRIGISRDQLIGQSLTARTADSQRPARALSEALHGRLATYQRVVGDRDLDVVLYPVSAADGSTDGAIGVAIDVTERRLAEVAQQESDAKSRFLAAMSHELRTPLNAVLGFAQLLSMDSSVTLSDRQLRYLDNIQQSGRHLLSLINEVLDLSRVAAGQMPVQLERVHVAEAIDSVVGQSRSLIDEKRLRLKLAAGTELAVYADARRLEQVLWNLVSNAIKFTEPEGGIELGAKAAGSLIEIWVADTGIGIPAEQLSAIFDEFTQVESTLSRSYQGTGLGLALSRRLVELMGGTIEVTSSVGRGSRFLVRLRADAGAGAQVAPAAGARRS